MAKIRISGLQEEVDSIIKEIEKTNLLVVSQSSLYENSRFPKSLEVRVYLEIRFL